MSADQHIKAWMHPNGSVITLNQKATAIALNNKMQQWAEAFNIPLHAVGAPAQEVACLDPHGCEVLGCVRKPEIIRLRGELAAAYAEIRKQLPAMTAVFDRDVIERAKKAGEQ
ncbi:MAG: hypothetical protein K2W80_10325 [Burkholderiales bacterium]|nr:hypothetical protein [Burkholderiales bacterium]